MRTKGEVQINGSTVESSTSGMSPGTRLDTPFSPNQDSTPQLCLREQAETLASPVGRSGRGARRRRAAHVARVFGTSETAVWADAHARGCESDATS